MEKLRLLKFFVNNNHYNCRNKVHVPEGLIESDFTELKYLHWYGCPLKSLKSLQPKFHFEKLVILEISNSNIEELWSSGVQPLHNLKKIDLGCSQHLISCPELSLAPNLESLILAGCRSLSEIPSSIQHLNKLESLNLGSCLSLESIPDCTCLESLKYLSLIGCSKLKKLPQLPANLEGIGLNFCTSLVEIQSSFTRLHKLRNLHLYGNKSLTSIPDLRGLKSLTDLDIVRCPKLKMLPELPNNIEELRLYDVPIEELPSSSEDLDRLRSLHLHDCSMLKSLPSSIHKWKSLRTFYMERCSKFDKLPDDIGALESLERFEAYGTAIGEVLSFISCLKRLTSLSMKRREGMDGVGLLLPPNLLGLENLSTLKLIDCGITKLPESLWDLTSLRNNFGSIPGSIINLLKLYTLDISYCERLRDLPQLPALTTIKAVNCTSLERSSYFAFQNDLFENLSTLDANFINCYNLDPDALNDFVKDTLLKIQDQAAFVTKDTPLKKAYYKRVPVYKGKGSIIYPESKIPEWFHYQRRGSFIDVKLPPLCLNCNFLCFALCVVVAIPNPDCQCNHPQGFDHTDLRVTYDCNVKSKDGNRLKRVQKIFEVRRSPGDPQTAQGFTVHNCHLNNQMKASDGAVTENGPDKHERKQYFRLVMNEGVFLRENVTNNHHMSKLHSRNGGID
ncbi:hypothetical protein EZV62_006003 [Acer yangbiense]|uniref:Uncharacterized protein n=1 Tax=Acer yangbiense TaxID=1000413 RepID=A0A5C7IPR3_9ROSI|nr:hypothetical protein EZV62_006003 [Acer yangbiense]